MLLIKITQPLPGHVLIEISVCIGHVGGRDDQQILIPLGLSNLSQPDKMPKSTFNF